VAPRRAPILTEDHWQAILEAAAPLSSAVEVEHARRELEDCLYDYHGLRQVSVPDLLAARKRWRRIDRLLRDLAHEYYEIKRRTPWTVHDPERPQRNILALSPLRQHAAAAVEGYDMRLRARQGKQDPAREWLFGRLFEIWTDCFHGKLAVSTPAHGSPRGPLIRFIRAVLAPLTLSLWEGERPSPETIRKLARGARRARKRQGSFQT
jgi:hypothetical protein